MHVTLKKLDELRDRDQKTDLQDNSLFSIDEKKSVDLSAYNS
jgi:hypothetical protein